MVLPDKDLHDIRVKLHSYRHALTKSEQKVAAFVLDHAEEAMYLPVTDLAVRAGVGESTVLRCCRKLGFKGYQEFKLALAKDHEKAASFFEDDVRPGHGMVHTITSNNIKALQETVSLLDETELEDVVDAMFRARYVHFYGVGTSGITALDAKSRFLRIGFPADAVADSHLQAMAAATLCEKDVAVGITVSGSTKDTVDALAAAKKNGATIVAITQFARSPVTKNADRILLTGGKESPLQGGSLAAKMAQLHMIDLLFGGIALRMQEKALYYNEKTAESVLGKIY